MTNAHQKLILLSSFSPTSLAFARSVRARGFACHLVSFGGTENPDGIDAPTPSSAFASVTLIPYPVRGNAAGIDALNAIARRLSARYLVSVSENDNLWLAQQRKLLEPDVKLLLPSEKTLELCASKQSQLDIAAQSGVPLLPTLAIDHTTQIDALDDALFPLCLRPVAPSDVSPSFKAIITPDKHSLRRFIGDRTSISRPLIAQPYKHLPDIKVHYARNEKGEITARFGLLAKRKYQGVSLAVERIDLPADLLASLDAFSHAIEIVGAYHFDLLFDPNSQEAYFLEINARMGGVTDKARRFGYEQPLHILDAFGLDVDPTSTITPTQPSRTVVNKRSIASHMVAALKGDLTQLDYPTHNRFSALGQDALDLLFARDSVFEWRDLRGSINFMLQPLQF